MSKTFKSNSPTPPPLNNTEFLFHFHTTPQRPPTAACMPQATQEEEGAVACAARGGRCNRPTLIEWWQVLRR